MFKLKKNKSLLKLLKNLTVLFSENSRGGGRMWQLFLRRDAAASLQGVKTSRTFAASLWEITVDKNTTADTFLLNVIFLLLQNLKKWCLMNIIWAANNAIQKVHNFHHPPSYWKCREVSSRAAKLTADSLLTHQNSPGWCNWNGWLLDRQKVTNCHQSNAVIIQLT